MEFANVIVLNKCDQMSATEKDEVSRLIGLMNPTAKLLESTFSVVPLDSVLGTGLFSMSEAEQHDGWLKEVSLVLLDLLLFVDQQLSWYSSQYFFITKGQSWRARARDPGIWNSIVLGK